MVYMPDTGGGWEGCIEMFLFMMTYEDVSLGCTDSSGMRSVKFNSPEIYCAFNIMLA